MSKSSETLFTRLLAAGCKTDNHESDLYVEDTPAARAVLDAYKAEGNPVTWRLFINAIDGKPWFDVPFKFSPWWRGKGTR